jgi:hypothetical protein
MAKKPEGDLGSMAISKAKAAETVPFGEIPAAPVAPPAKAAMGGVKSLTVKLEGDTYAALRTYCFEQEQATGSRLSHQQVMVQALKAFLATNAGGR